jgi:hypothetical protein
MEMSETRFGKILAAGMGIGIAAALVQPSVARELGILGIEDLPGGGTNGSSADNVPVGIFLVNQFHTTQISNDRGPTAPLVATAGNAPNYNRYANVEVFIFNPGWSFLGATTQFIYAQPFVAINQGNLPPGGVFGTTTAGVNDPLFKADAAWKWGDWHVKIALGAWAPLGTQQGPLGLSNVGLPLWTIQPEFVLSWEPTFWDAHWNFTAYTYWEISTENMVTHYQNAPIFHADFTATATYGKWTIGPVADFLTQVGHDTSSAFYANTAVNGSCLGPIGFECLFAQDISAWNVGGLLQYNFGPVSLQFWATDIVYSKSQGGSRTVLGDTFGSAFGAATGVAPSGYILWFQLSYALWTPQEQAPAPKAPLIYK